MLLEWPVYGLQKLLITMRPLGWLICLDFWKSDFNLQPTNTIVIKSSENLIKLHHSFRHHLKKSCGLTSTIIRIVFLSDICKQLLPKPLSTSTKVYVLFCCGKTNLTSEAVFIASGYENSFRTCLQPPN